MRLNIIFYLILFNIFSFSVSFTQTILKDELDFLTSEWEGERFADGRPKVADNLLRELTPGKIYF